MAVFSVEGVPQGLDADVTGELLAFFATVPDGTVEEPSVVEFPSGSVFRVDGEFRLIGREFLEVRGNGVRLVRVTPSPLRGDDHVRLTQCRDVRFDSVRVEGTKPAGAGYVATLEAQHAWRFESSERVTLDYCQAEAVWGDCLYVGRDIRGGGPSRDIVVRGFWGGECGRDSLAVTSGVGVKVMDSRFGTVRTGVDFEPNGTQGCAIDVYVDGCKWLKHQLNFASAISKAGEVSNIRLTNNSVLVGDLQVVVSGYEGAAKFDWLVGSNTGAISVGNGRGCVMQFTSCSGPLMVVNNTNPVNRNRGMVMAKFVDCTGDIVNVGNVTPIH